MLSRKRNGAQADSTSFHFDEVAEMYRTERLVVRLSEQESQIVDQLAAMKKLPASTLARQLLFMEAEKRKVKEPERREERP